MNAYILLATVLIAPQAPDPVPNQSTPIPVATCFKTGEQVDGMNKICYYDCLGSAFAITIGATQLCPLTVKN